MHPREIIISNFSYGTRNIDREVKVNGLKRLFWTIKPLNAILRWLGATWIDKTVEVHQITIPRLQDMAVDIQQVVLDFEKHTGERTRYLIIGHDVLDKLRWCDNQMVRYTALDTMEFLGMKLILHPFVNGIIPIGKL